MRAAHVAEDELRDDLQVGPARFDTRLRNVEIAFGKVDQLLVTIERIVVPPAEPAEQP